MNVDRPGVARADHDDRDGICDDISPMRGVMRTLQVLRALNVRNGATVVELSRDTGISRGALYRVLETLREMGYVALDLSGRHYCLTMLVRGLADGFTDEDWITEVARPALRNLQKQVLFPADLATFMDNSIWVRETTRQMSPMTIDRGVVGIRLPMLRSAAGRAYLAFCPEDERRQILANIAKARDAGHELVGDPGQLDRSLDHIRTLGYGARYGEPPLESGAIAVPIRLRERVLGCVVVTFIRRAMSMEEAAERYISAMQATATAIAAGFERLDTAPKASASSPRAASF